MNSAAAAPASEDGANSFEFHAASIELLLLCVDLVYIQMVLEIVSNVP